MRGSMALGAGVGETMVRSGATVPVFCISTMTEG